MMKCVFFVMSFLSKKEYQKFKVEHVLFFLEISLIKNNQSSAPLKNT